MTLKFEKYSSMIECYYCLEKIVNNFQSSEYRKARCINDLDFWTIKIPNYYYLLTCQTQFWLHNSISEENFLKYVDTGDAILFRSHGHQTGIMGPNLTRAFTGSHFDHVAIVMRFGDHVKDLYILEAVGETGVRLASWVNIRNELYDRGFYEKLITRKLIFNMTTEKLTNLDMFRRNTVGRSYGLTAAKLLFN